MKHTKPLQSVRRYLKQEIKFAARDLASPKTRKLPGAVTYLKGELDALNRALGCVEKEASR